MMKTLKRGQNKALHEIRTVYTNESQHDKLMVVLARCPGLEALYRQLLLLILEGQDIP